MTLLSVSDAAVTFGATTLLSGVTFTVARGERWGIVGRNGAGKSTIFRLITGAQQPSRGQVVVQPGTRITMLDQFRDFGAATTVWQATAAAYAPLLAMEAEMETLVAKMAEGDEAAMDRYGRIQERYAHEGGYDYPARVDAVLQGLGFDPQAARETPLATLSGGERGRVGLAAQLAAPTDLLLLDEPTNHLDLDTIDWLRDHLRAREGTVLVISHDRAFLDDLVDHVLHVHANTSFAYRGGYSSFVTQRAERLLSQQRAVDKQQKTIAKEEDYIRRNIAGRNSAQAKGRRARLERLPRLSPPPGEMGAMSLRLEIGDRGGDRVLHMDRIGVAVGDRTLVHDATLTAMRGDVIALVGRNGAGKSTLIQTVLGERPPQGGTATVGGGIVTGWYRQDQTQLPLERSIFDAIQELRPLWGRGHIQNHLGAFGFSGDTVLRKISSLSGGERARVALAMIVLQKANFLVLDEPTNHLDVESIEAIEDAIDEYDGTVLLVSHDRAVLRELATRVWWFDGTRLHDFDGPFVEWEAMIAERGVQAQQAASARAQREREAARAKGERDRSARTQDDGDRRRAKRALEEAEAEVTRSEQRVHAIQQQLTVESLYDGSPASAREAARLEAALDAAQQALELAMARWMECTAAVGE
jgi:ATP-binding cassette subfamily F protein 3